MMETAWSYAGPGVKECGQPLEAGKDKECL